MRDAKCHEGYQAALKYLLFRVKYTHHCKDQWVTGHLICIFQNAQWSFMCPKCAEWSVIVCMSRSACQGFMPFHARLLVFKTVNDFHETFNPTVRNITYNLFNHNWKLEKACNAPLLLL